MFWEQTTTDSMIAYFGPVLQNVNLNTNSAREREDKGACSNAKVKPNTLQRGVRLTSGGPVHLRQGPAVCLRRYHSQKYIGTL